MSLIASADRAAGDQRWGPGGGRLRRLLSVHEVGVVIPLIVFALIFYLFNDRFLSPISIASMLSRRPVASRASLETRWAQVLFTFLAVETVTCRVPCGTRTRGLRDRIVA